MAPVDPSLSPSSGGDDAQAARLALVKTRALARKVVGERTWDEHALAGGAALTCAQGEAVVLIAATPEVGRPGAAAMVYRRLGAALAWADKARVERRLLHVLVDGRAGIIARQAALFADPPTVWEIDGADVRRATPQPYGPVLEPSAEDLGAVQPLLAAGAAIAIEHGVVLAEIEGLEVGRVVDGRLEAGVGQFDRAAGVAMEAVQTRDQLVANVVRVVGEHRRAGAPPHPLNRLERARWLRALALADPSIVDAAELSRLELAVPRPNLVEPLPALAHGRALDQRPVVVAFSVGVNLDAVPLAADAANRSMPAEAELVLVTPARDRYPALARLLEGLIRPTRQLSVEGPWSG